MVGYSIAIAELPRWQTSSAAATDRKRGIMSNALRDVVESGAHTFSDLVDEARTRIEDLPPIARARRKRSRKSWSPFVVVLLLAIVVATLTQRHRRESTPEVSTA